MPQLYAPNLLMKLNLLIAHSDFERISDIAAELGVKEHTLRSWTKDHGVQPEGTVSRYGRESMITLFCAHLPELSRAQVTTLLEGPCDDMASAFGAKNRISLAEFIDAYAHFRRGKLFVADPDSEPGDGQTVLKYEQKLDTSSRRAFSGDLITTKPIFVPNADAKVELGQAFRTEFKAAHRGSYVLGLQQSPQGWGSVPSSLNMKEGIIHLPGLDETSKPQTMWEHHDLGNSRFAAFQSTRPFPAFIETNIRDGIPLSRTDLGFLVHHLQSLASSDLNLSAMDVGFVEP